MVVAPVSTFTVRLLKNALPFLAPRYCTVSTPVGVVRPNISAFPTILGRFVFGFADSALTAVSELAPQPVAFYAAVFFLVNTTYIFLIRELIDRTPVDDVPPRGAGSVTGLREVGSTAWGAAKRNSADLRERIARARDQWAKVRHARHTAAL